MTTAELRRRWAWPALGALLIGALALRLWGLRQGLPYAYNTDEADHFVPRAVAMFAQFAAPVAQYISISGSGVWTASRT